MTSTVILSANVIRPQQDHDDKGDQEDDRQLYELNPVMCCFCP